MKEIVLQLQAKTDKLEREKSTTVDFDGSKFLKAVTDDRPLNNEIIEKYAPNVVEGVQKLSNWAKNL